VYRFQQKIKVVKINFNFPSIPPNSKIDLKNGFFGGKLTYTQRDFQRFLAHFAVMGGYGSYATMSITDDEIYYLKIAFVGSQRLSAV
jgi:hypothetical protein